MTIPELINEFNKQFSAGATPRIFFAPGRINLIGEHMDYNGGHVFPAAISFGTYALATKRADQKLRFYSVNFPETGIVECDLSNLAYNDEHDWANYPKGMIHYMMREGHTLSHGADILYYGNIPNGAGLSSSASIEMVTGILLESIYQLKKDRIRMIQVGQKVENEYIGVNSGIMDQFAIGMGKKDHALLLNCQTLDYQYAPLALDQHVIIVMNTNKRRTLAGSKYNERRTQCEFALKDLQTKLDINSLGDVTKEQFEQHKHLIADEINRKRAKHVVYENARTIEALKKLQQHDLFGFGALMNQSHLSLQNDYEVTGYELDTITKAAWEQDGVVGARMTGAGFGGCAIAIIPIEQIDSFRQNVNRIYQKEVGYEATFYTATIGDEAKELSIR
ncbi:galactokinase [Terrihalobacillus insolitus]|uniref:galactokinase n=1 Tax=Terrihalobacillus insolitus TaxID=2950438 RepID=UPI00233FBD50|nr:galactokinase [Terrihalobacillus insolitus]MDC3414824.1 galactokinase [Terrihalobacillus insolitus]